MYEYFSYKWPYSGWYCQTEILPKRLEHHMLYCSILHYGHWPHVNVCRVSCGRVFSMRLVLSITFYFHYSRWGCVQLAHFSKGYWKDIYSSCYYHHQIGSIHLSHCYNFPWSCVWDVCYIIFHYLLHIHSGKTGNSFSLLFCSLWWVQMVGYVLPWRSYSFIYTLHHLIIIIVQIYLKTLNL